MIEVRKRFPDQLIPRKSFRYVWPGDSAVDREKSDFFLWCDKGLEEGLEYKKDCEPDIIRMSLLGNTAFGQIAPLIPLIWDNNIVAALMAFRYAYRGSPIDRTIIRDAKIRMYETDEHGLRRLTIDALDFFLLEDFSTPLPMVYFSQRFAKKITGVSEEGDEERDDEYRPMTLPHVLGAHVLAHSFLVRQDSL